MGEWYIWIVGRTNQKQSTVKLPKLLFGILSILGAGFTALFLVLALIRLRYPFELEWMEGAIVDHVLRIMHGQPLYAKPSLEFIPFIYTPLFYYVSAVVSWIIGPGFLAVRLVSILSTISVFALIFQWVKRETNSKLLSATSVGLFAASYGACGYWYDIGRVDMLAIALLFGAGYLIRGGSEVRRFLIAGCLLGLAFLAKQSTLLPTITLTLYAVYYGRLKSLWLVLPALAVVLGTTLWFDAALSGWYSYYVFVLPNRHTLDTNLVLGFWTKDIFRQVPIMLITFLALVTGLRGKEGRQDRLFWICFVIGALASSWSMRMFAGGFENALIPTAAVLAITAGIFLGKLSDPTFKIAGAPSSKYVTVFAALFVVQFGLLWYNPAKQIPTKADEEWGNKFIDRLKAVQGEILLPYHGYIPVLAGKTSCAHKMALVEIRSGDSMAYAELERDIKATIAEKKHAAIILNADWFSDDVAASYRNLGDPFPDRSMFYPVTGLATRPHYWFVSR